MRFRHSARAAGVALALAGCAGSAVAPDLPSVGLPLPEQAPTPGLSSRRVASIGVGGDGPVVDVPAVARAGEAFTAVVTTYGGGCITEDTTVATVRGARADVVPYQVVYTPRANEACTLELRITRRPVRLTFASPGPAQVAVTGRGERGDSLVTVVRQVEVR